LPKWILKNKTIIWHLIVKPQVQWYIYIYMTKHHDWILYFMLFQLPSVLFISQDCIRRLHHWIKQSRSPLLFIGSRFVFKTIAKVIDTFMSFQHFCKKRMVFKNSFKWKWKFMFNWVQPSYNSPMESKKHDLSIKGCCDYTNGACNSDRNSLKERDPQYASAPPLCSKSIQRFFFLQHDKSFQGLLTCVHAVTS
jgi:hypothetical protein